MDEVRAVHDAASSGDVDKVWDLIEHDQCLLEATHDSDSPLSRAAENGHVEVVVLLLDHRVEVNRRLFQGWTALCAACYSGHVRVAELLLERGADPTQTTTTGSNPLILAAEEGHADVAALLIKHGCVDIDRPDAVYRHTALWLACCNGHDKAARELLAAGADFLERDGRGRSPLQIAERQRHKPCVGLLQVRGGPGGAARVSRSGRAADPCPLCVCACARVWQECERAYMIVRARRLRDVCLKLGERLTVGADTPPAFIAARCKTSGVRVEVRAGEEGEEETSCKKRKVRQGGRASKRERAEGSMEEQVLRCVVVGMSTELFFEWAELLGR